MKREIKFRLYNPETGESILSTDAPDGQLGMFFQITDFLDYQGKPYEIMQYTGLKDKNGVEIYEGDVVKNNNKHSNAYEDISVVNYHNGIGGFTVIFEGIGHDKMLGTYEKIEVIGNIHQHPHLLTPP